MTSEVLKEFFAVTENSLYQFSYDPDADQPVIMRRLSGAGEHKEISVAHVTIGRDIHVVISSKTRGQIRYGRTDAIIALFLRKLPAWECSESKGTAPHGVEWRLETERVKAAIGPHHPVFGFSQG